MNPPKPAFSEETYVKALSEKIRYYDSAVDILASKLDREIHLRRLSWFCVFLYFMFRWIYG